MVNQAIHVRLDADDIALLDAMCKHKKLNRSDYIREYLLNTVESQSDVKKMNDRIDYLIENFRSIQTTSNRKLDDLYANYVLIVETAKSLDMNQRNFTEAARVLESSLRNSITIVRQVGNNFMFKAWVTMVCVSVMISVLVALIVLLNVK